MLMKSTSIQTEMILLVFVLLVLPPSFLTETTLPEDYYFSMEEGNIESTQVGPKSHPANEITAVKAVLNGNIDLSSLEVLTKSANATSTRRTITQQNEWDKREIQGKGSGKRNEGQTIATEFVTKGPTDAEQLMDVFHSTSGTLPTTTTEKLIIVTPLKSLIDEGINSEKIQIVTVSSSDSTQTEPTDTATPIESTTELHFPKDPEASTFASEIVENFIRPENLSAIPTEEIEDLSSFLDVDEKFLSEHSEKPEDNTNESIENLSSIMNDKEYDTSYDFDNNRSLFQNEEETLDKLGTSDNFPRVPMDVYEDIYADRNSEVTTKNEDLLDMAKIFSDNDLQVSEEYEAISTSTEEDRFVKEETTFGVKQDEIEDIINIFATVNSIEENEESTITKTTVASVVEEINSSLKNQSSLVEELDIIISTATETFSTREPRTELSTANSPQEEHITSEIEHKENLFEFRSQEMTSKGSRVPEFHEDTTSIQNEEMEETSTFQQTTISNFRNGETENPSTTLQNTEANLTTEETDESTDFPLYENQVYETTSNLVQMENELFTVPVDAKEIFSLPTEIPTTSVDVSSAIPTENYDKPTSQEDFMNETQEIPIQHEDFLSEISTTNREVDQTTDFSSTSNIDSLEHTTNLSTTTPGIIIEDISSTIFNGIEEITQSPTENQQDSEENLTTGTNHETLQEITTIPSINEETFSTTSSHENQNENNTEEMKTESTTSHQTTNEFVSMPEHHTIYDSQKEESTLEIVTPSITSTDEEKTEEMTTESTTTYQPTKQVSKSEDHTISDSNKEGSTLEMVTSSRETQKKSSSPFEENSEIIDHTTEKSINSFDYVVEDYSSLVNEVDHETESTEKFAQMERNPSETTEDTTEVTTTRNNLKIGSNRERKELQGIEHNYQSSSSSSEFVQSDDPKSTTVSTQNEAEIDSATLKEIELGEIGEPEIVTRIGDEDVKFSVKITGADFNFFIPPDAYTTFQEANIVNITWKSSSSSRNNSLGFHVDQFEKSMELRIVKGDRLLVHRSGPENKLQNGNNIALDGGIRVHFSNITDLLRAAQNVNQRIIETDISPSTSQQQTKALAAEIMGGCIGFAVVSGIVVYFTVQRCKGRTRSFKPNIPVA